MVTETTIQPSFVFDCTEEELTVPGTSIRGILSTPTSEDQWLRPVNRVIVICHGMGGHKDYIYHKLVADRLCTNLGFYVFRFDFRGAGDSGDVPDLKVGRNIQYDLEDLDNVIFKYLIKTKQLTLGGLIGHSRGSTAVLLWASTRSDKIVVPTIVNCGSRFRMHLAYDRYLSKHSTMVEDKGFYISAYRHGTYKKVWIPHQEISDYSAIDDLGAKIKDLNANTFVLSIYGLEDKHIPVEEADQFSQALCNDRHSLRLIFRADHNYVQQVENSKPIKHHDKIADIIEQWFSPDSERDRFMTVNGYVQVISRWKNVEGVDNFRDFGGYRTMNGNIVRPGMLFRSAHHSQVTNAGKQEMIKLGIKSVFDFRSFTEIQKLGYVYISGITREWVPIFDFDSSSSDAIAKLTERYLKPTQGFKYLYRDVLENASKSFAKILTHLRDRPNDAIVFHCVNGKDRTGIAAAIILMLLGVDNDTIARDYELTTHGLREVLPKILAEKTSNDPRIKQLYSSRYEAMAMTIKLINEEFGGVEQFVTKHCGLTNADITQIRANLLVKPVNLRYML